MKKLGCLILSLVLALSAGWVLGGCGKKDSGGVTVTDKPMIEDKYVQIWSEPSTKKVLKTEAAPKSGAISNVKISAAKGEGEAGQIIIRAKDEPVYEFSVDVTDLSSGSHTLKKENISLYAQHYVKTKKSTTSSFPVGWYPDAIIPMQYYVANAENTFAKNSNQGIWITVNVPRDQAAGQYAGKVNIDCDGTKYAVDLSVKVYDFVLSQENHARTAFAIFEQVDFATMGYKLSEITDPIERAQKKREIIKAEREFLLSYKISPTNIPLEDYKAANGAQSPSLFAREVKTYAMRPEVSAYRIPTSAPAQVLDRDALDNYLNAILLECVDVETKKVQADLFKKAYFYVDEIDEPHPSISGEGVYDRVDAVDKGIKAAKQALAAKVDANYSDYQGAEQLKQSIEALQHLVTSGMIEKLLGKVQTWVPQADEFNTPTKADEYARRKAELGEGYWWYTCIKPKYPYPSYHIDDTLVSARAMGWMQKKYGIDGNLYWATNVYGQYNFTTLRYDDRDVWTNPMAYDGDGGANGDGFLTYPGIKYGVYEPIGTVRLEAIRDSNEDYEYLYMAEELLKQANAQYATNFTLEDIVGDFYDEIFSGSQAVNDSSRIIEARESLAGVIEALTHHKAIVYAPKISGTDGSAQVTVYAPSSASVTVNGAAAQKEGSQFTAVAKDGSSISVKITLQGKTVQYNRKIGSKIIAVDGFEGQNKWVSSAAAGGKLDFSVETVSQSLEGQKALKLSCEAIGNVPKYSLAASNFDVTDFSQIASVVCYMYNPSDSITTFSIALRDKDGSENGNARTGYLYPKKWVRVQINVRDLKTMDYTNISHIVLYGSKNTASQIIVDNVYLVKK